MGLSIKNNETEQLVRELARRRGLGVTTAIKLAVMNELSKDLRPSSDEKNPLEHLRLLQKRWAELPDKIPTDDIDASLYDENGLPH